MLRLSLACACLALGASALRAQYNQYGVHDVTSPVHAPDCGASTHTTCFTDSTRHYSDECCMRISSAGWLVMGRAGDSVEFFARSAVHPVLVTLDFSGRPFESWQERVARVTAAFVRVRLPRSGVYRLTVDVDLSDTILVNDNEPLPYELRVHRIGGEASEYHARLLQILSPTKKPIRVQLRALASDLRDAVPVAVPSDTYRVLARPGDRLEVCRVPCRQPRSLSFDTASVIRVRP